MATWAAASTARTDSSIDILRKNVHRDLEVNAEGNTRLICFKLCSKKLINISEEDEDFLKKYVQMQRKYPETFTSIMGEEVLDDGNVILWLDLGEPLADVLKVCGLQQRKKLLVQLLIALSRMQEQCFLHQDISLNDLHCLEVSYEEWTLRCNPMVGSVVKQDSKHAMTDYCSPLALLVAQILNSENMTIKSSRDVEHLVLNLVYEQKEDMMSSLLKLVLNSEDTEKLCFADLVHFCHVDSWTPHQWLLANFEISNFMFEEKENGVLLSQGLNQLAAFYLPEPPHNWVKKLTPEFFEAMAPHYVKALKEVVFIESEKETEEGEAVPEMVQLKTSYDGNAIDSLGRLARHLFSHRIEKKETSLQTYIPQLNPQEIYACITNLSNHYFKTSYLESLSHTALTDDCPHLYPYEKTIFPSMQAILGLKPEEVYEPRKIDMLSRPRPRPPASTASHDQQTLPSTSQATPMKSSLPVAPPEEAVAEKRQRLN